jgi:ribosomal protein S17
MAKKKQETKIETGTKIVQTKQKSQVKLRGRTFQGVVVKKLHGRLAIEFERLLYVRKYERYEKRKTKLHARIPLELEDKIEEGDYVEIAECRPLSKLIHCMVTKVIKKKNVGGEKE